MNSTQRAALIQTAKIGFDVCDLVLDVTLKLVKEDRAILVPLLQDLAHLCNLADHRRELLSRTV